MFNYVVKKLIGTKNQRELRKMAPVVKRINEREGWATALSDVQMREQWRRTSVIGELCFATVSGHGAEGYDEALALLREELGRTA